MTKPSKKGRKNKNGDGSGDGSDDARAQSSGSPVSIKGVFNFGTGGLLDADGINPEHRELANRIKDSIAHTFDRHRDQFITQLNRLVEEGKHIEAALTLIEESTESSFALEARNTQLLQSYLQVDIDCLPQNMGPIRSIE